MRDKITLIQIAERLKETHKLDEIIKIFIDLKTFCAKNIETVVYTEDKDDRNKFTSAEIKIDNAFVFSKIIEPKGFSLHISNHIYAHKVIHDETLGFEPINQEQEIVFEKAFSEIQEIVSFYRIIKSMTSPLQIGK